jgi:hypothetical protein
MPDETRDQRRRDHPNYGKEHQRGDRTMRSLTRRDTESVFEQRPGREGREDDMITVTLKDIDEVMAELRGQWPQTFCWPPRPLQVGIDQEIEIRIEVDPMTLARALECWVSTPAYLLQCAWPGAPRFDPDGRVAGVVTEIDALYARRRLVIEMGWRAPGGAVT